MPNFDEEYETKIAQAASVANIFYTRDDNSTRHYMDSEITSRTTVCGKIPYVAELLALPVNCEECRIQLGKLVTQTDLEKAGLELFAPIESPIPGTAIYPAISKSKFRLGCEDDDGRPAHPDCIDPESSCGCGKG